MLPPLHQTLVEPEEEDVLELDELWSFVARRKNKQWVWLALCRRTRQVVAYAVGERGEATCRRLWARIPLAYRQQKCYTDFWKAYALVVPEEQHMAGGKETGQTNHIERFNNTLRQRLARFVRDTLSFSKKRLMHKISLYLFLYLFLHDYNQRRAELYNNSY